MDTPFKSDGCSGVLDLDVPMRIACLLHDFDYWVGGTDEQRYWADVRFAGRIWRYSRWWWLAPVRFLGVRWFGAAGWQQPGVSWNYGWRGFKRRKWSRHAEGVQRQGAITLFEKIDEITGENRDEYSRMWKTTL